MFVKVLEVEVIDATLLQYFIQDMILLQFLTFCNMLIIAITYIAIYCLFSTANYVPKVLFYPIREFKSESVDEFANLVCFHTEKNPGQLQVNLNTSLQTTCSVCSLARCVWVRSNKGNSNLSSS